MKKKRQVRQVMSECEKGQEEKQLIEEVISGDEGTGYKRRRRGIRTEKKSVKEGRNQRSQETKKKNVSCRQGKERKS